MSRAKIDVVAPADMEYNSTLNDPASEMSSVNKAAEETALSDASINIVAKVIFAVGGYVKIKWLWNGKPLATFKSRDYDRAEALAFLEDVKNLYDVYSTLGVDEIASSTFVIADNTLTHPQSSQTTFEVTMQDAGTADVTSVATYSSSDTTKATVNSAGLVTSVAAGTSTIRAQYRDEVKTLVVTVS